MMHMEIPFVKMVASGNDFLIIDTRHHHRRSFKAKWAQLASAMCDRRYGVGADGVLVLEPSRIADCQMRVFNPDGSEAEMCGNGARCVAQYVTTTGVEGGRWKVEGEKGHVTIETKVGTLAADVEGDRVAMRMPDPRDIRLDLAVEVDHRLLHVGYVNTGVPHAVVPVASVDRIDVGRLGRQLRSHRTFHPQGTNVDFVEVRSTRPRRLRIRTYERGVEGETLACGTGVTAAAVIHALRHDPRHNHADHRIAVETKSGETLLVSLSVAEHDGMRRIADVTLKGTVRWICQGVFAWPLHHLSPSPKAKIGLKGRWPPTAARQVVGPTK